ncbi:hypothetical protein BO86DRAFT_396767 [Aspergillus japonicus CBS 114.51]|uniref:Actin-like ATPase domain-containing protein n=1 Tax=Aspergillus japonicus CBS 114.51 TaxID=1448312 RepID=A0A8T8XA90_ASPJA|nr:hypothetical protein BO86DRAFT_396767 [Aspergillus japonicus CBS 114.51]RAH85143.1 hypothetical protein BO86DRAFT_396767 [Aspergillus japonicus CBS 114.51]
MASYNPSQIIIVEVGRRRTYAGFASDDAPHVILNEDCGLPPIFELWPEGLAAILQRVYEALQVAPAHHPILLAISPTTASFHAQADLAQMMFQRFHIPALEFVPDALLLARAANRTTAAVVNFETSSPYLVAVVEGVVAGSSSSVPSFLTKARNDVLLNGAFELDVKRTLLGNIVVPENMRYPEELVGLRQDMTAGMSRDAVEEVRFVEPEIGEISVWRGAILMAAICSRENCWVVKEDFEEKMRMDGMNAVSLIFSERGYIVDSAR